MFKGILQKKCCIKKLTEKCQSIWHFYFCRGKKLSNCEMKVAACFATRLFHFQNEVRSDLNYEWEAVKAFYKVMD